MNAAKRYEALQSEFIDDERRALIASERTPRNHDGSNQCGVVSRLDNETTSNRYRVRCSCGYEGQEVASAEYAIARNEMNEHRSNCK